MSGPALTDRHPHSGQLPDQFLSFEGVLELIFLSASYKQGSGNHRKTTLTDGKSPQDVEIYIFLGTNGKLSILQSGNPKGTMFKVLGIPEKSRRTKKKLICPRQVF